MFPPTATHSSETTTTTAASVINSVRYTPRPAVVAIYKKSGASHHSPFYAIDGGKELQRIRKYDSHDVEGNRHSARRTTLGQVHGHECL